MRIPNGSQAYVSIEKLLSYLLSEAHAVGKSKARFFRGFGFNETNVKLLEQGFLKIAQTEPVDAVVTSSHGVKYVIDGLLQTPKGDPVQVRTVWIIEAGQEDPRFVTAYPVEKN